MALARGLDDVLALADRARPRSSRRPPPARSRGRSRRGRRAARARACRTPARSPARRRGSAPCAPTAVATSGASPPIGTPRPGTVSAQRPGGVEHHARGRHQVRAGGEAPVGRLVERLGDHGVEPERQLRAQLRGLRRRLREVRVDHRDVGVAGERDVADQAVEEQARERVDVGAGVDVAALDLLRARCSGSSPRARRPGSGRSSRRPSAWSARSRSGTRGGPRSARCRA